jgi:hypothetical protein
VTDKEQERDRDADGRYAPKGETVTKSNGGRFKKGQKRPANAGRRKGTPNKATRAWKDFVKACSDDTELQDALRQRCLDRPDLLLRVAEHAVGRPKETVAVEAELKMFIWPDDSDVD